MYKLTLWLVTNRNVIRKHMHVFTGNPDLILK